MKRAAILLFLSLAFTQCTYLRGKHGEDPSKHDANNEVRVLTEREQGRERDRAAHDDGEADGNVDAGRGAANDYQAHRGRFNAHTEQAYREGYREGFAQSRPGTHEAALTSAQQAAHDAGYAAGLRDRRMNRGSDPDAHAGTYDVKFSSWFLDGYQEGFEGR